MGLVRSYRLRLERKRWLIRAFRKRRELKAVVNRTHQIQADDILLVCTVWNEQPRLAYFLKYYRNLGIRHFLFIDNGSDDGTGAYLERQSDVSLWRTEASYKRSRFGMDWVNW
ncbi:MAG: glycosyltransferase family 2 protein, partial [Pseudomonadota bacterium]